MALSGRLSHDLRAAGACAGDPAADLPEDLASRLSNITHEARRPGEWWTYTVLWIAYRPAAAATRENAPRPTIDSDSVIERGALLALAGPFREPKVGAVAGRVSDVLLVNPYDTKGIARAIQSALAMPLSERRARYERLVTTLRENDIHQWHMRFLEQLTRKSPKSSVSEAPRVTCELRDCQ